MRARIVLTVACLFGLWAAPAQAQGAGADELAFIRQHVPDVIRVTPTRLADAAAARVFRVPIYELKVVIGGDALTTLVVTRMGDSLAVVSRPSTDEPCPQLMKMLNPAFRLSTPADAETLQAALDAVFPLFAPDEKAAKAFRRAGAEWTFVRGKFFDDAMGFVVTTNAAGAITGVRYGLRLGAKAGA